MTDESTKDTSILLTELLAEKARMQKLIDLLALASHEIGSSLDYAATVQRSTKFVVSALSDSVVLISIDADGRLSCASCEHSDPQRAEALKAELESGLDAFLEKWHVRETIRTGETYFPSENSRILSVPIRERGEVTGVLCFEKQSQSGFSANDRALSIEFTDRIGIALGNAKLYEDLCDVERKLAGAKKKAEEASRAKSAFLATMSHEIRTPLTAILGFSELLLAEQPKNAESEEFAARIRQNGGHLMRLIDDILNLAKVESGKVELEIRKIDLPIFLLNLESVVRGNAKNKGLEFSLTCKSPIPVTFDSDPTRLNQILTNLLSNAIKFTSKGRVELAVEHKKASNCLVFTISDTGLGLTEQQAQKLFQPFSQADASHTRRFGGTGLGLALSRKLAQLLGGDVDLVKSKPNAGATFQVVLPIKVSSETGFASAICPTPYVESEASEAEPVSLGGENILLVDDSEDNRILISRILKSVGATVKTATNGIEAISTASDEMFSVILMDVQMPEMDGLTATMKLRSDGYAGPIISLTAHALEEERRACLLAGADDHLTKPVNKSELIRLVARWCKEGRGRDSDKPEFHSVLSGLSSIGRADGKHP